MYSSKHPARWWLRRRSSSAHDLPVPVLCPQHSLARTQVTRKASSPAVSETSSSVGGHYPRICAQVFGQILRDAGEQARPLQQVLSASARSVRLQQRRTLRGQTSSRARVNCVVPTEKRVEAKEAWRDRKQLFTQTLYRPRPLRTPLWRPR